MTKRKPVSASELWAELAKDPEHLERVRLRDEKVERQAQVLSKAEAPLVQALQAAGANVKSVWDLLDAKSKYPKLIPVLLDHLDRRYPERIREGIARALAVKEARPAWDKIVDRFLKEPAPPGPGDEVSDVKWALHLALSQIADLAVVDELVQLAADRRLGHHRSFLVDALAGIADPRARAALEELKDDPDLAEGFKRLEKKKRDRARRKKARR